MPSHTAAFQPDEPAPLATASAAGARAALYDPMAVIDLGAYSARLQICQRERGSGTLTYWDEIPRLLPLGRDVFRSGVISSESMRQAAEVMRDFAQQMREMKVRYYHAVATSAVRESLNREVFIHRIQTGTGIQIEPLDGSTEVRLISLAVQRVLGPQRFRRLSQSALLLVLGAGSSQLACYRDAHMQSADTIRLGTLRLGDELGERLTRAELEDVIDPFVAAILGGAARLWPGDNPRNLIAVGAPVRALMGLDGHPRRKACDSLTRAQFRRLFERVERQQVSMPRPQGSLTAATLQSIEPCCHILDHLFAVTGADRIWVPMVNTRDALVDDLYRTLESAADPFVPDILTAAHALAARYCYDAAHGHAVADFAARLFDGLATLHHMPARDRVLLQVAAILHDIGCFVSGRQHHKHSHYLIANSELPGITSEEQETVALAARYHRRSSPKLSHPEYAVLPPPRRVQVCQLAALLRVADALDRGHRGRLRLRAVRVAGQRVALCVGANLDFAVEQWGLKAKAGMFEEVYGYRVELVAEDNGHG
ncbi:MAG: Guanosine-5'-triphosphate,3'-diphosphate pyrophosphatase [Lentisphaerae bacterium ADurb.BinA184]|nr:MAG: Guanosine-5'-triphosphate,3'-diphosphate pyrophosphatase [Lentisphaerae bacterium ADurb.BinA184]